MLSCVWGELRINYKLFITFGLLAALGCAQKPVPSCEGPDDLYLSGECVNVNTVEPFVSSSGESKRKATKSKGGRKSNKKP